MYFFVFEFASLLGMSLLLSSDSSHNFFPRKSLVQKLGKRSSVVDENCRQSYDPSNQPLESVDSIFMTFEGEKKQLISVGLQGEHSYARSLAHFAGTLWPVAWKFASKRIEQALPVAGLGNMSHIPQTERLVPLKNLPKRNSSI